MTHDMTLAMDRNHYALLAALFDYPGKDISEHLRRVRDYLSDNHPQAMRALEPFCKIFEEIDLHDLQELFTRSFDVQAITTLEIGYVLFGDDYKRGELLANLNREHRLASNDCQTELADHLPNVLRLMSKMEDQDILPEMVQELVFPAVGAMLRDFDPKRLEKMDTMYRKRHKTLIETSLRARTVYCQLLEALHQVLKSDFQLVDKAPAEQSSDFLKSMEAEIKIEEDEGSLQNKAGE